MENQEKERRSGKKNFFSRIFQHISKEIKYSVGAILLWAFALFFVLAAFDKAGILGQFSFKAFFYLFGLGYFLMPVVCILLASSLWKVSKTEEKNNVEGSGIKAKWNFVIGSFLFLISSLGLIEIIFPNYGGKIGFLISKIFIKLFDKYVSLVFLFSFFIASVFIIFNKRVIINFSFIKNIFLRKKKLKEKEVVIVNKIENLEKEKEKINEKDKILEPIGKDKKKKAKKEEKEEEEIIIYQKKFSQYVPPPLSLLEGDQGVIDTGNVKVNANIIKRTLQNFGISVEMDEVVVGPTVTRYALKPAEGVKVSRIVTLKNDLALALAAHPLRIEAPIPGKSLVGIEVPNKTRAIIGLASLFSDEKFTNSKIPLLVALGKSIGGQAVFGNISKMPHLLIGGSTGSGKSVLIHSLINSLLFRLGPEILRFIFIDPKRVELTIYNDIPHLLTPVITDPKKAIFALKWLTKEMERRYQILETEKVRDISSYHKKNFSRKEVEEKMPYIVVVVDELADLMTTYPREMEAGIVRLAQMARAVGIHLIVSTQRPSVDVITGLIKANIPARIALQVASQIDSRTILDSPGAESLLGAGDMLWLSGEMAQPQRLQGAFVSEDETKAVVKFIIENNIKEEEGLGFNFGVEEKMNQNLKIDLEENFENIDENEDPLYEEAKKIVIEAGKASTSYLQRRLKIGYSRAARLIDLLESKGIVGPADGSKPRIVLSKNEKNNIEKGEEREY